MIGLLTSAFAILRRQSELKSRARRAQKKQTTNNKQQVYVLLTKYRIDIVMRYFVNMYDSIRYRMEIENVTSEHHSTVLCQKALSAIFCHFHFFTDYDITSNYASAVKIL